MPEPPPSEPESSPSEPEPLESAGKTLELLKSVLASVEQRGTPFGRYVLYEQLGRGGFGVVHRARRVGSDEMIALNQMRGGPQASAKERSEFLAGAKIMAELVHSGIVRVLDFGEAEDCPYFTMELIEGRDLAAKLKDGPPSQEQAARWLAAVARAIAFAHARGVVHGDLKPANILLDAQKRHAFVVDFGSAKRLSAQGACDDSGSGVLSPYMAPEQANGGSRGPTADIYGLGVMLYELLTGQVPYEELAFASWVAWLASPDPVRAPRQLVPSVHPDLELICLKCLEKDPSLRYSSALLLAEDLEAVLEPRRLPHARPPRAASRSLHWLRRRPMVAFLLATSLLFAATLAAALFLLRQSDREQQRAALETNAFLANSQAGALLAQLRDFADGIERCAKLPEVAALLARGEVTRDMSTPQMCERGFQHVLLLDTDGRALARWPAPEQPTLGKNYAFRGYFRGARVLSEQKLPGAFLSPAYQSEAVRRLTFAFAAPVRGKGGEWLGAAVGQLQVASVLGQVSMRDSSGGGHLMALLGPRGADRDGPQPPGLKFIVHPSLDPGREVAVDDPSGAILRLGVPAPPGEQFALRWAPPLLLSDYRDPLLPSQPNVLAALAPVGQTGYVVAVQTEKSAVQSNSRALLSKLVWRAGLPFAMGVLLLGITTLSSVRRRRQLERRPTRPPPRARLSQSTAV